MKIIASVAKSSHQDHGPFYLHLPIFYYPYTIILYIHMLFCWKIKSCCHCCFFQQIRPQITGQLNITRLV